MVYFSKDGRHVLLEIMDAKYFVLESLDSVLTATLDEGGVYVLDKKERNISPNSERAGANAVSVSS